MKRCLILPIFLTSLFASDLHIEKIVIQESALSEAPTLQKDEIKFTRQQDLAEILSQKLPEINMVRASAIGNDIVLRGFKRDDINVLIDGAKIYGACPNRMDPPAMHVSIANIKTVRVQEGPFDVENFGSMGGSIDVITKESPKGIGGSLEGIYGSFGYNKAMLSGYAGDEDFRFGASLSHENSDQYEDGDGKTLAEQNWERLGKDDPNAYQEKYKDMDAYTRNSLQAKALYHIDQKQTLKLSLYSDKATNVLYPAFQMDAQLDKTMMLNAQYSIEDLAAFSKRLTVQSYYSTVLHDMGTKFRNAAKNPMKYRTHHVRSSIKGIKLKNSFAMFAMMWKMGLDGSKRVWNGICLAEPTKKPKQVRIPDVNTKNGALFLEGAKKIGNLTLKAGFRYDDTKIDAKALHHPTIANILPIQHYYAKRHARHYKDISAHMVVSYKMADTTVFASLGQGVRVPDGQELYFIGFMKGNWTRRGNPDLKETKNRELDIGIDSSFGDLGIKGTLFYSDLKDYIYAYRTNRGNKDLTKYYLTWTNIDAHIYGGEFSVNYPLGDFFLAEGGLSWQRGKKDDLIPGQHDRDMAMIPPLRGRVALSYDDGDYYIMVESLLSDGYSDIDSDNGEQKIGGWAVVNLKFAHDLSENLSLHLGCDNIFDKTYALNNTYVGRSLIGGRTPVLINEPGRYLYANLTYSF